MMYTFCLYRQDFIIFKKQKKETILTELVLSIPDVALKFHTPKLFGYAKVITSLLLKHANA